MGILLRLLALKDDHQGNPCVNFCDKVGTVGFLQQRTGQSGTQAAKAFVLVEVLVAAEVYWKQL